MTTSENYSPAHGRVSRNRHEANGNQCAARTPGRPIVNEPNYRPSKAAVQHNSPLPQATTVIQFSAFDAPISGSSISTVATMPTSICSHTFTRGSSLAS